MAAPGARVTLRERFFPLHDADSVDRFLDGFAWSVVFKAGTSEKTFEAWHVAQAALEPRRDVAVGFVRLPEGRTASDRVAARAGIAHRSPQFVLFERGVARFHLDEFAIAPDRLLLLLREHLPLDIGPTVRNEVVVSFEPYRAMLAAYVDGTLPEERFQWGYLDRLAKEALWRDDQEFELLNSLFENAWGRDVQAAEFAWSVIFKAGTSEKTFDAWRVAQVVLEPRRDVAVGFVRLPQDRLASDRVATRAGIAHRSPQFVVFERGVPRFHLDEFAIALDQLVPLLREHLPLEIGPTVRNEGVVSLEPYRAMLTAYVDGTLPEERFQWGYLDRLAKEAQWRDEQEFELLNSLFENAWGRDVQAARLIAVEFQGQLAGRLEPLAIRAKRLLTKIASFARD